MSKITNDSLTLSGTGSAVMNEATDVAHNHRL